MFYLIEHNRTTKTTECDEYTNYSEAQIASLKKEQHFLASNRPEVEVVVFETNSLADLRRTHSRYFAKAKNNNGASSAVGLVGLAAFLLTKKR